MQTPLPEAGWARLLKALAVLLLIALGLGGGLLVWSLWPSAQEEAQHDCGRDSWTCPIDAIKFLAVLVAVFSLGHVAAGGLFFAFRGATSVLPGSVYAVDAFAAALVLWFGGILSPATKACVGAALLAFAGAAVLLFRVGGRAKDQR